MVGTPYILKSSLTNQNSVFVRKLTIETAYPEPAFAQSDTGFYEVKYATGTAVGPSGLFTPESAGMYLLTNQLTGELGRVIDVAPGKAEFPLSSEEMASAMRYITSEDEFNTIMRSHDLKTAVDSFWITVAGNPQRAMLLIKNYFSRVAESSKLFSSAIPGWKTDRGLIYIVWGKPNLVYRNKDTETWIYSEGDDAQVMNFDFKLFTDRFGLPEYRLVRSLIYREAWYNAIESLRR
jgi:GWxTD domain-containing protein